MMMKEQIKSLVSPYSLPFLFPTPHDSREQSDEIATNRTRLLLDE